MSALYNKLNGTININRRVFVWKAYEDESFLRISYDEITNLEKMENLKKNISLLMIYTIKNPRGELFKFDGNDRQVRRDKVFDTLSHRDINQDEISVLEHFSLFSSIDKNIFYEIFNDDYLYYFISEMLNKDSKPLFFCQIINFFFTKYNNRILKRRLNEPLPIQLSSKNNKYKNKK